MSFLVPTGVFALCVLLIIRMRLRRPTEGVALLEDAEQLGELSWHTTWEDDDSKLQVIWDLSEAGLQDRLQDLLKVDTPTAPLVHSATAVDEGDDAVWFLPADVAKESARHFMWQYLLDQRVEYYSSTHAMWLPGQISNAGIAMAPKATLVYDVALMSTSQVRECVALELVRPMLMQGEPCSVFSTGTDRWTPAFVYGKQSALATNIGYRVKLVGGAQSVLHLPASHLRRRFPPGCLVEAFEDEVEGWVEAKVVGEQVQEDVAALAAAWKAVLQESLAVAQNPENAENPGLQSGEGSPINVHSVVSGLAGDYKLPAPRAAPKSEADGTSRSVPLTARSTTPRQEAPKRMHGDELCRWTLVEIVIGSSGVRKTLPSFRLRHAEDAREETISRQNYEIAASFRLAL
eukprot:TRINITY_DN3051_c0_g1_i2.p1 TRINITY_DN3051_c0_g1~~TRINITY_DN3051_c0_g1_i2.p1  ORF type:complete len:404 (+),score=42.47 TRINITY_DN3051_c0_g1_i2:197-1408(+)